MNYVTWLREPDGLDRRYEVEVTSKHCYFVAFTLSTVVLDALPEGERQHYLALAMHHAERKLWHGIRAKEPDAFAEAVRLGWIEPPNDRTVAA